MCICSWIPACAGMTGSEIRGYSRRLRRHLLRRIGALKSIARLQTRPIGAHRVRQVLVQAVELRKEHRVADGDVCRGEPAGTDIFRLRHDPLDGAQASVKPARIILSDLWLAAFRRLQSRITQHDRLWKSERRLAEMQEI